MTDSIIANAATALFVPGHRSERFAKAQASGAGFAIIDLEDAVPAALKTAARDSAVAAVSAPGAHGETDGYAVRINAIDDGGLDDALALAGLPGLRGVMVPKAERGEDLLRVDAALGGRTPLIPLIETAVGLAGIDQLAAVPRVSRLAFGAYDFAADVDASDPRVLDHARIAIVLASRRAGVHGPLDSPEANLDNPTVLAQSARSARGLGFSGKLCIHPAQVSICGEAFQPTEEEVRWAQRILEAPDDGATSVDGEMVDRPVRLKATAILARRLTR